MGGRPGWEGFLADYLSARMRVDTCKGSCDFLEIRISHHFTLFIYFFYLSISVLMCCKNPCLLSTQSTTFFFLFCTTLQIETILRHSVRSF